MARYTTVSVVLLAVALASVPGLCQTPLQKELEVLAGRNLEGLEPDWRAALQEHLVYCVRMAAADAESRRIATVKADPEKAAVNAAGGLETYRLVQRLEEKVALSDMFVWKGDADFTQFSLARKSKLWLSDPLFRVDRSAEFRWLHWTALWEFLERYDSLGPGFWVSRLAIRQNFSDMRYVMGIVRLSALGKSASVPDTRARDKAVVQGLKELLAATGKEALPVARLGDLCPAPGFEEVPSMTAHHLFMELVRMVAALSRSHAGQPGTPESDPVRLFEMDIQEAAGGMPGAGQGRITLYVAYGPVLGLAVRRLMELPCIHDVRLGRSEVQLSGKLAGWVQMDMSFGFGCEKAECLPGSLRSLLDPGCRQMTGAATDSDLEEAYAYLEGRVNKGPLARAGEKQEADGHVTEKNRWVHEQELVKVQDAWTYLVDTDYVHGESSSMDNAARSASFFSMRDQVSGQPRGVKVVGIHPGSLLDNLGLRTGDVLVSVGDRKLSNAQAAFELFQALNKARRGETVKVTLERRGVLRTLQWTLQ